MPIPTYISRFLDSQNIPYQTCRHSPVYTAQGIAQAEHISSKKIAKVVMVRINDGEMIMAVIPANYRVDLEKLARLLNRAGVRLATENEFKDLFPECEIGAMPPFGNLYNMEVWVDESLRSNSDIVFNAGTHTEAIQMSFAVFEQLVRPNIGSFGVLFH